MNNLSFDEQAIPLITVSQSEKYEIHPDGANFLSQIQKPIGVVVVSGLQRTGKSYFIDRMFLNKNSGFSVGLKMNDFKRGLWCWNKTIKGKRHGGESINVIVVETQSIGAQDGDLNHTINIFTLAVLSASTFIFNYFGIIDQQFFKNYKFLNFKVLSIQQSFITEIADIN